METNTSTVRARIEGEITEDLQKPLHQLLSDIHEESVQASSEVAPLTRSLARFSSLLGVLSIQAERDTKKVVNLTWGILALTVVLLLIAALQVAIMLSQATTEKT